MLPAAICALPPEGGSRAEGFDSIVWLSPFPWRGCWQTPHYLAAALGASGRLPGMIVTPSPGWRPAALLRELSLRTWRAGPPDGLRVPRQALRSWPVLGSMNRRRANLDWAARQVAAAARSRGFRRPLLWVFYANSISSLVERLGWPYVYHCLDHFDYGDAAEQMLLANGARTIFAASNCLRARFAAAGLTCYHLPNGVALEWFRPAAPDRLGPAGARHAPGRVIGYAGVLNRHIDFRLLMAVAQGFPACELVLLGPVVPAGFTAQQRADLRALCGLPNVRRIAFRPTWKLAPYLRQWDVALMPNLADAWSQAASPLKLWQYLALGLPVVAAAANSVDAPAEVCYRAGTRAEFLAQVRAALLETAPGGLAQSRHASLAAARIAAAQQQAWPRILERALAYLSSSVAAGCAA